MKTLRLIFESFRFALTALRSNLLRTILSLLGVTVGIFSIILVFTVVDSLERNVKESLAFLGDNVIYVEKWPWIFGPEYPWWKFVNRPQASYPEYEFVAEKVTNAKAVSIMARRRTTARYGSNSTGGVTLFGVSYEHQDVADIPVENGRYFSPLEVQTARNVAVIGANVVEALFPTTDPLGKELTIKGQRYQVIGVMKRVGENLLDGPSNDDNIFVPYKAFLKAYYSGRYDGVGSIIAIKGKEGQNMTELLEEVRGVMRQRRGLRPREEDTFALNQPQMLSDMVSSIFGVITIVGAVIGSFAILIGGFGIANIMFVSVRERTNQIGIQKSLGAKRYFILLQFLFEAVFLSLLGGIAGLLLVYPFTFISFGALDFTLSLSNVVIGLGLAVVIGIISGLMPAWSAARMDPVTAIRTA
ncbi:ABC transporter permease [Cesiribacter andamanensis]|uniref:Macrolide export ATP-binding/permease protein MacB n=1 Tax=Cesiribacter andamanensis AMV16 TaxID=1279009 RepID=M7N3F0_9BACT|nr:ABC transporter permease [Cesiribacter andamanensis]EMR01741.1 Macrolide export ATP-binding/permease protein MacB [Cesiribacter andamanensis AMV16]